jgi:hypothetical protein
LVTVKDERLTTFQNSSLLQKAAPAPNEPASVQERALAVLVSGLEYIISCLHDLDVGSLQIYV